MNNNSKLNIETNLKNNSQNNNIIALNKNENVSNIIVKDNIKEGNEKNSIKDDSKEGREQSINNRNDNSLQDLNKEKLMDEKDIKILEKKQTLKSKFSVNEELYTPEYLKFQTGHIFKNKLTIKDISSLPLKDLLKYDDRSNMKYLWDLLKRKHSIISTFVPRSILNPRSLSIIFLFFNMSVNFALNAIFYSDTYINARGQAPDPSITVFKYKYFRIHLNILWEISSLKVLYHLFCLLCLIC